MPLPDDRCSWCGRAMAPQTSASVFVICRACAVVAEELRKALQPLHDPEEWRQ